uniref:Uncharacterized protein n=1 Tax=Oryza glumipatula TaxID=40148 RepID=A0A0D9YTI4_9ORYZ
MREREQRFRKKQGDDQRGSEKKKDNMDDRIVLVPSSGLESTLQLLQLWINPYAGAPQGIAAGGRGRLPHGLMGAQ